MIFHSNFIVILHAMQVKFRTRYSIKPTVLVDKNANENKNKLTFMHRLNIYTLVTQVKILVRQIV